MKQPSLTELVICFARARTPEQRRMALSFATNSARFDEDQRRELNALLVEARNTRENVHALRPITNPVQDCPELAPLVATEAPVFLSSEIMDRVSEWVRAWNRADELRINGLTAPGPMLLCGPTGTGKTMLTRRLPSMIAGRTGVVLDAHRVVGSLLGETGSAINKAFSACDRSGSLLVIEEIDAIAESRTGDGSAGARENNRITIALMRLIESATFPIVITCNRPDALDVALLRRFELRLDFTPMDEANRAHLLFSQLGGTPDAELLALPLGEAIARVQQIKRKRYLDQVAA